MMRCCIAKCTKRPPYPTVSLCREHLQPHLKEMERRKSRPFDPPVPGAATHKLFNYREWYWYRDSWRLSA